MQVKSLKWIATAVACAFAVPAWATWSYERSTDKFTDELVSIARETAQGGALIVRCKDGFLETYLVTNHYLDDDGSDVRYRIDKGEVDSSYWTSSTDGSTVFSQSPAETARALIAGGRLVIEASDFNGTRYSYTFSLAGSGAAVGKVLSDCGLPRKDPRLEDPAIWRRVVQSIDEVDKDTVKTLQTALNIYTGEGLPETGVRTTATYRVASEFYAVYWYSCENAADKELHGPCKTWIASRKYDEDADYGAELWDVLQDVLDNGLPG